MRTRSEENSDISLAGFSLLEVMITISILLGIVVAVAAMLRASVDLKQALARDARITHRLSISMSKIAWDIEHAFIIGINDVPRGGPDRKYKTLFRIDRVGENDKLSMTMTGNISGFPGAPEGDTAYVVYEIKDAQNQPGRKDLYRGVSSMFIDGFREDPPMRLLVRNIKSFKVIPWTGEAWATDNKWDSSRGEWRDKLPAMVKVEIETDNEDDDFPRENQLDQSGDQSVVAVKTVVMIQQARGFKELKQGNNSVKWF